MFPMQEIRFIDTTIRDGQQSLWATGMRTHMMLPAMDWLDRAGFDAIEIHANSFEKKMLRELQEDPFERLRLLRARANNTPLRIIRGRYLTSFQICPHALENLWYERMAAIGIQQMRTSDSSNNPENWRLHVEMARNLGIDTVLNLIFSISPRHTDEYYAEKAAQAAALHPYRICLKDPGALLTPDRLRTLVPAILGKTGDITVEFHTHCNTGLGGLCTLEAIKLGIHSVNTAIPPLAEGSSNPSTFDVARNARILGFRSMIDEELLKPVEDHFRAVAAREGLPVGAPLPYDAGHYIHQVPGGMISNLRFQLGNAGLADRLPAVLDEIGRVRADFGYPIMVTPYSQFMGAQAVMNVLAGERYRTVSDEIIQYAIGFWGENEASLVDPDVRDRILERPRARELALSPPRQATIGELRARFGGTGMSDEDMLMRIFTDDETVAAMRTAGGSDLSEVRRQGIAGLIEALSGDRKAGFIQIGLPGIALTLRRNAKDPAMTVDLGGPKKGKTS
jgi:oxaloacetate decarboxylase alpha subunit